MSFLFLVTHYSVKHYISRFWKVEISLHFNLAFSQCSISIYQAFDGQRQTEFLPVFNFAILSYSQNSRKFDARKKCFTVAVLSNLTRPRACNCCAARYADAL